MASVRDINIAEVLGKSCNFTVNRDHINKSKETRVVAYTSRYSSGQLIPIFQLQYMLLNAVTVQA